MPTSLQNSHSHLITRMVDLLWHQWSSIGVAGYARPGDQRIIDPEALLLATTRFGRYDSRLMDESIDWLMKYGQRISLQRLRGLNKSWPGVADSRVLSAIAEMLGQQAAHRKWRVLVETFSQPVKAEPLFIGSTDGAFPESTEPDPIFAKHGLLRSVPALRNMSQSPDPHSDENLIFTLRALLGVNARAEIMAWLLTHESGHPAAIARSTGYFSKSVQQTLNEMAGSGQLSSIRIGREKYFSLAHCDQWQALLRASRKDAIPFPSWVDWMPLFSAITRFVETLGEPGIDDKSESFKAIHLREALAAAAPALVRAGRAHNMKATPHLRGAELITALLADLETLLALQPVGRRLPFVAGLDDNVDALG